MRDVGIHFNISQMLSAYAYKKRLEQGGLTFFEMGYMLMQAFDFVHLNDKFGCVLEIGGSDQWGNIIAGVDLSRKMASKDGKQRPLMMGLTCPLLTNAEGVKMGKTEKGTFPDITVSLSCKTIRKGGPLATNPTFSYCGP